MLSKSKLFKASSLGVTYVYALIDVAPVKKGAFIHLYNLTLNTHENVDEGWFKNREIMPIKDENGRLLISIDKVSSDPDLTSLCDKYFIEGSYYSNDEYIYQLKKKNSWYEFYNIGRTLVAGNLTLLLPYIASKGCEFKKVC